MFARQRVRLVERTNESIALLIMARYGSDSRSWRHNAPLTVSFYLTRRVNFQRGNTRKVKRLLRTKEFLEIHKSPAIQTERDVLLQASSFHHRTRSLIRKLELISRFVYAKAAWLFLYSYSLLFSDEFP